MVIIQKLKSQGKHKLNQNKYFKCFKTVNKWFKILHKVLVCSSVFCFLKLQFFFSIEGNPLHFTRLSWWNRFITSNIFLSMIYFLNEAFQEATLNFSFVHYWSPRITTSSQVCWIFKQLVAILVRLGALSFKHIFFPKIISKWEKQSKSKITSRFALLWIGRTVAHCSPQKSCDNTKMKLPELLLAEWNIPRMQSWHS